MDMQKIGGFLRDLRKQKGLSQEQLATAVGVTQGAVSQWEKGRSKPSVAVLMKLADALGVTIDSILKGA